MANPSHCTTLECFTRLAVVALSVVALPKNAAGQTMTSQQRLSRYVDQRFGMFIHFNMNTYHAGWGENRVDPKTFAPPNVDCHAFTDQWAAAAKSAGMKFGLLTAKHHDGFAIWPSKAVPPSSSPYGSVPYTIAQSSVPTMDVVRCYVDSFRAQGLDPNLYFSIWDPNNGIGSQAGHNTAPGAVDWNVVGPFIRAQITELLSNYGNIPLVVFDGYSWLTGHQQVPYQEIRALVRSLQPDALVMDHNGGVPWQVDVVYFEEPLGVRVPSGNVTPGAQGQTIAKNQDWFWDSAQATTGYLGAPDIANELKLTEPNYTDFILDCPPNPQGLLDAPVVAALGQVPSSWTPNLTRAPLPPQLPKIETPFTAVSATATSSQAGLAIDGYNDWTGGVNNTLHGTGHGESLWISSGALPQSVTLDLGTLRSNVDMLEYLPQRHTGTTNSNITAYKVLVSIDNVSFDQVASGTWPADPTYHALLGPQRAQFSPRQARYVRLEIDAVSGGSTVAVIGDIGVGSSAATNQVGAVDAGSTGESGLTAIADASRTFSDAIADSGGTDSSPALERPEANVDVATGGAQSGAGGSKGSGEAEAGGAPDASPGSVAAGAAGGDLAGKGSAARPGCGCRLYEPGGPRESSRLSVLGLAAGLVLLRYRVRRERRTHVARA